MYNLSTKAHEGPQQPTKADAGPRRWKTAQTTERYLFFLLYNLFFIFYITSRLHHPPLWRGRQPRKPTKAPAANEGPCRPTKREKGPNDARHVVWARGKFFFNVFFLDVQLIHEGPRRPQHPTKADAGLRRGKRAQTTPDASFGP